LSVDIGDGFEYYLRLRAGSVIIQASVVRCSGNIFSLAATGYYLVQERGDNWNFCFETFM
jgi:hypothetical protein